MRRRKFLIGAGSFAAATAGAIGTGAFSEAQADRDISVNVADDSDAFLKIEPAQTPNGRSYAEETGNPGTVEINFDANADTPGSGLSDEAFYNFEDVLAVENQGSQAVGIQLEFLKKDGSRFKPGNPALASVSGPVERATEGGWYRLDVGERVGVGFFFNLNKLDLDEFLENLDTIVVHADANQA